MREDELYSSGIFASELDDEIEDAPEVEKDFPAGAWDDEDDDDLDGGEAPDLSDDFKTDDWN